MNKKVLSVVLLASVLGGCNSGGDSTSTNKTVENASICFNENLYTPGAEYNLTFQDANKPAETINYKVLEDTVFRGQAATRIEVTNGTSSYYSYLSIDNNEKSVSQLGNKSDDVESYYEPAMTMKFNLNKGDSYEQTTTLISEASFGNFEFVYIEYTTFKGIETITVPAGSYKTCKFEINSSFTNPDGLTEESTYSSWYTAESGIPVQAVDEESTHKLVEADINGTKI